MTDEEKIEAYDKANSNFALKMREIVMADLIEELTHDIDLGRRAIHCYSYGLWVPHKIVQDYATKAADKLLDELPKPTAWWRHIGD